MRKKFLDFDARPEPKTDRWCVKCQRDVKPGRPVRIVRVLNAQILHPDDAGEVGEDFLVGLNCAGKIGLEWSRPER